ncbi:hypothetical protein D7030_01610 [Flavobacteriaceae bacterium AU392]|nr:hypothetical protein D1817_08085 [Flavobacteriaceae bacterium]RKM85392.1 hypothetical protein D7030_01610 [Flavobacteriaceae bacterium AU392]
MKNLKNLGKALNKNEQKLISGGFGGVPIASTCDYNSLQSCLNACTRPGTECAPCADNNPTPGTYECRVSGFIIPFGR